MAANCSAVSSVLIAGGANCHKCRIPSTTCGQDMGISPESSFRSGVLATALKNSFEVEIVKNPGENTLFKACTFWTVFSVGGQKSTTRWMYIGTPGVLILCLASICFLTFSNCSSVRSSWKCKDAPHP